MVTRKAIIQEARNWLGTRFCHQGRIKINDNNQGGCDCIGLIIGIAQNLKIKYNNNKLLSVFDRRDYSKTQGNNELQKVLNNYLVKLPVNNLQLGNVALFQINPHLQHVGIISNYDEYNFGLIHCYAQARKVVEHCLDKTWQNKIVGIYSFYGIED